MEQLKNWIWDQHKNDPEFTEKKFAHSLGISSGYFSAIKHNRMCISYQIALAIQEKTNNAVTATELMAANHNALPRKIRGKRQKAASCN